MPIFVVCPGCKARFNVSEKYAGKSGACPKCKAKITIPAAGQEVKVHTPAEFAGGGRNAEGKLVAKPIARQEVKVQPVLVAALAAAVVLVLGVTWGAGRAGLFQDSLIARAVGLLLISTPLAMAPYTFLRNDELEPLRGRDFYLRAAICGLVYVVLWGAFAFGAGRYSNIDMWWLFVVPPLVVVGGLTALACFELDFGSALFHYAFYLLVTIFLRWVAGMGWIWQAVS